MKKTLLFLILMIFIYPDSSYAIQIISKQDNTGTILEEPYYDVKRDTVRFTWSGSNVVRTYIEYFHDAEYQSAGTKLDEVAKGSGHWFATNLTCTGWYKINNFDSSGKVVHSYQIQVEPGDLITDRCQSYGDGPVDPNAGANVSCSGCKVFECPEWDAYLGKLDAIKNAIPPSPNWNQVSQTFSDAIVPRLVSETKTMLSDLLGQAPSPPPSLPDLPGLDDKDLPNNVPKMDEVPGLNGITENDVKQGAPIIPFEEDPTEGFNLGVDPMKNLPDVVPGGDPGVYKRDPKELPTTYPGKPKDTNVDMGGAPTPNDGGGKPPSPGESGGAPPKPGDNVPLPGKPDDVTLPGKDHYMPKPGGG